MVTSIKWVVDTNIVRGANPSSDKFMAKKCAEFLNFIKNHRHMVVMTNDISQEWKKQRQNSGDITNRYMTQFSKAWYSSMLANKLVDVCKIADKDKFYHSVKLTEEKTIKDAHLMDAALNVEGISIIASDEDNCRKEFFRISQNEEKIKDIVWLNPTESSLTIFNPQKLESLILNEIFLKLLSRTS